MQKIFSHFFVYSAANFELRLSQFFVLSNLQCLEKALA